MKELPLYSDIDLSFVPNPKSGDLMSKLNTAAIQRSVSHLARLESFDIPFHPEFKSGVRKYQFEQFDRITLANMRKDIEIVCKRLEPRIKLKEIKTEVQQEGRSVLVTVYYTCESLNTEGSFNLIVERVR